MTPSYANPRPSHLAQKPRVRASWQSPGRWNRGAWIFRDSTLQTLEILLDEAFRIPGTQLPLWHRWHHRPCPRAWRCDRRAALARDPHRGVDSRRALCHADPHGSQSRNRRPGGDRFPSLAISSTLPGRQTAATTDCCSVTLVSPADTPGGIGCFFCLLLGALALVFAIPIVLGRLAV